MCNYAFLKKARLLHVSVNTTALETAAFNFRTLCNVSPVIKRNFPPHHELEIFISNFSSSKNLIILHTRDPGMSPRGLIKAPCGFLLRRWKILCIAEKSVQKALVGERRDAGCFEITLCVYATRWDCITARRPSGHNGRIKVLGEPGQRDIKVEPGFFRELSLRDFLFNFSKLSDELLKVGFAFEVNWLILRDSAESCVINLRVKTCRQILKWWFKEIQVKRSLKYLWLLPRCYLMNTIMSRKYL